MILKTNFFINDVVYVFLFCRVVVCLCRVVIKLIDMR